MNNKDYSDIIDLPHHVSKNRTPMSLYNRAAQFAPFSALHGYEEALTEISRQTSERVCLSDTQIDDIAFKIQILKEHFKEQNEVTIKYFQKDKSKEGGIYVIITSKIKKFDDYHQTIVLVSNEIIHLNDVVDISSPLFSKMHI